MSLRSDQWAIEIGVRAGLVGLAPDGMTRDRLGRYLELLADWNCRTNLTGFELSRPEPAAIDRLIVEPLRAASCVPAAARRMVDVGSGGGSPGIPLALANPDLHVTLIEARSKKCEFLRVALRELGLAGEVIHGNTDDLAKRQIVIGLFDVMSLRAVRADERFWRSVSRLVVGGGTVLWFVDKVGDDQSFKGSGFSVASKPPTTPVVVLSRQ